MIKTRITYSEWYTFFRFTLAMLLLTKTLSFIRDIPSLWFEDAFVKTDIISAGNTKFFFGFTELTKLLQGLIGKEIISFDNVITCSVSVFIISLIFLAFGFLTKFSNLLVLAIHLMIQVTFGRYSYGIDQFITVLLFYLFICQIPKNVKSLDYFIFKGRFSQLGLRPQTVLSILQIHLCIIYCISGFEKGLGVNWWNGESIWRALHGQTSLIPENVIDSIPYRELFVVSGWLTIAVEFLYPLFINIKSTRKIWLSLTIVMHLFIIAGLGLIHFGLMMIFFNLVAFAGPELDGFKRFSFTKKLFYSLKNFRLSKIR